MKCKKFVILIGSIIIVFLLMACLLVMWQKTPISKVTPWEKVITCKECRCRNITIGNFKPERDCECKEKK